jgi:hypothetical protein
VGATHGDRAETGNGKRNSDDLARTRALAERDVGERDREHRLKWRSPTQARPAAPCFIGTKRTPNCPTPMNRPTAATSRFRPPSLGASGGL